VTPSFLSTHCHFYTISECRPGQGSCRPGQGDCQPGLWVSRPCLLGCCMPNSTTEWLFAIIYATKSVLFMLYSLEFSFFLYLHHVSFIFQIGFAKKYKILAHQIAWRCISRSGSSIEQINPYLESARKNGYNPTKVNSDEKNVVDQASVTFFFHIF